MADTKNKRNSLGKGLGSLLGLENQNHNNVSDGALLKTIHTQQQIVMALRLDAIEANPGQPRKIFDDDELLELSASIEMQGVIQPIIVTKSPKQGRYVIVAGERRWRASQLAGKDTIPAIVREGSDEELMRIALVENIQRADLNIIEEAQAYESLIKDFGLTQEACAKKVGKDRATVSNTMRLLMLPAKIQDDLLERRITMGHGRAILSLESNKKMLKARDLVLDRELSVRETEKLVKSIKNDKNIVEKAKKEDKVDPNIEYFANQLRDLLKTKVKVSGSKEKGKIEIHYFNSEELTRLYGLIASK